MDFGLAEDQVLFEQTTRSFLADRVSIQQVREFRDADSPLDRSTWRALAELGVSGILVPEAQGGSGLRLLDAAIVAQSLGHAVTPAPFLSSSVMATVALTEISSARAAAWLAGIASGELIVGVALTELFSRREGAGVSCGDGRLRGKAMMALDACGADLILVASSPSQIAVVRREARGVETNRLATTDATRSMAEVLFDDVLPEAIFENASGATRRALDAGRIVLAADTLGACESMIEQSVRYAGERKQFGRLIGSFQAVKHMCAEMVAELEPARSLMWYAAHSFDALWYALSKG